ncbi:MAG: sugar phosphate nucleotidyltransferase [Patescibacteria group bacterium]|nr:sugar phosphate nucleotidyltransferase [Patescibacteria group bacterium]
MRAIIPIAGLGTRLRPHTYTMPKAMMKVAGKTILGHIMDIAINYGAGSFSLILGEKSDVVKDFVKSTYSVPCNYYMQHEFSGLASAISLAGPDLADEPVLVILGDTIFEADMKPVIESGYTSIAVKEVDDPRRLGIVEVDRDGFITKLIEKPKNPKTNLALVGVYYFRQGRILAEAIRELHKRQIKTNGEYQITDAIQLMVENGEKIRPFKLTGWYDCGTVESFLESNQYLVTLNPCRKQWKDSIIIGDNYIPDSVTLEHAVIGPFVSLGEHTVISHSIIENSLIDDHTTISYMNINKSIIGSHVKLQGNPIEVNIANYSIVTQTSKL